MNDQRAGLEEIRVDKNKLLKTLKKNRDAHREVFEKAMDAYKTKAIEMLNDHIERIKANAPERVVISLPMPEDHTDDYDHAIEMIEWSLDDELWLDTSEFATYVRDDWGWMKQTTATAAFYGVNTK